MIERNELLIGPWRQFAPGALPGWESAGWGRAITDPITSASLGFVRATRLGGRWRWLTPRQLDVCETEDASLLMTLRHAWFGFGRWHVIDAESRRLGVIVLPHVLDGDRGWLGVVETEQAQRVFRGRTGSPVATFETTNGGLAIRFGVDLDPNPFLRMVVLGAALAADAPPR